MAGIANPIIVSTPGGYVFESYLTLFGINTKQKNQHSRMSSLKIWRNNFRPNKGIERGKHHEEDTRDL